MSVSPSAGIATLIPCASAETTNKNTVARMDFMTMMAIGVED